MMIDAPTPLQLVASYGAVGQYGGVQHLSRQGESLTLCGRNRDDWMLLREADLATDLNSARTCARCRAKATP